MSISVLLYNDGTPIDLSEYVCALEWGDMKGELAARAQIDIPAQVGGRELSDLAKLNAPLEILISDTRVFSGIVWDYTLLDGRNVRMNCYDRMIFLSGSTDFAYFSAGYSTRRIIESICRRRDVPLNYTYKSTTHGRISYRARNVADQIVSTLDAAKSICGTDYFMRMEGNTLHVGAMGEGDAVCAIDRARATGYKYGRSMDNLITRAVVISGSDSALRVRETLDGDTTLGILQAVVDSAGQSISDARAQAREMLRGRGTPEETIEIECTDTPTLRRGDRVRIDVDGIEGQYDVLGVMHDRAIKMQLTLKRHEDGGD